MKIIVCGAGRVGEGIARKLSEEGNTVTVIDLSSKLIQRITTDLDVRGFVGHGAYPETLEKAGAAEADMLIAVTHVDEVNMVACQVAYSLFNIPVKIARVRAQGYLDPAWRDLYAQQKLPVDVIISPEIEVGQNILRRLETPGTYDSLSFAEGRVSMVGVQVDEDCSLLETPLHQLKELFPDFNSAHITAIKREERWFIPQNEDQILAKDHVYVTTFSDYMPRILDLFGKNQEKARRILVVGGGNIGTYVAQSLEKAKGLRLSLIEIGKQQAEEAALQLNHTMVLQGDALDWATLREAGIAEAEAVICLTNEDKVNLLSSVIAKREGAGRTICLINEHFFIPLQEEFGIDVFVDPRSVTISTILQHVRRGRIVSLRSVDGGQAEAIEAVALKTSPLVGLPLGKMNLPSGLSIGAILRNDEIFIPDENFIIQADDHVILFILEEDIRTVEQLFRVSPEYF